MSQIVKAITLPNKGSDWAIVISPVGDFAISPNHIPMIYYCQRWCVIVQDGEALDSILKISTMDHYYHA
jgi:hypothetical protein